MPDTKCRGSKQQSKYTTFKRGEITYNNGDGNHKEREGPLPDSGYLIENRENNDELHDNRAKIRHSENSQSHGFGGLILNDSVKLYSSTSRYAHHKQINDRLHSIVNPAGNERHSP